MLCPAIDNIEAMIKNITKVIIAAAQDFLNKFIVFDKRNIKRAANNAVINISNAEERIIE